MLEEYLPIVGRSVAVYLFIIIAIHLFGKKEIAQLSVPDLVFILLISNAVQNAMVGPSTSLDGGIIAAISLFGINYLFKLVMLKSKRARELVEGHAIMLIYDGKIIEQNLKKFGITEDELKASVREHGVEHIRDVDLAVFEVDGNISVLSDNYKHRTSRKRKAHKVLSKVDG